MRWIRKRPEPPRLATWRQRYVNDINFGYDLMRMDAEVVGAVEQSLLAEQGGLCAYTGRRVAPRDFHIEHVIAQDYCHGSRRGLDVNYRNLIACYPAPNTGEAPYGAHPKRNWPNPDAPEERERFVSPLDPRCEDRFDFNYQGEIKPVPEGDAAATETISRLRLNHPELVDLRKAAIRGALQPNDRWLTLKQAETVLRRNEAITVGPLPAFHFVVKKALRNHIGKLRTPP